MGSYTLICWFGGHGELYTWYGDTGMGSYIYAVSGVYWHGELIPYTGMGRYVISHTGMRCDSTRMYLRILTGVDFTLHCIAVLDQTGLSSNS